MEEKTLICTIEDKKLIYNIKVGSNVIQAVDCKGKEFTVKDLVLYNTSKDGEDVVCTNIITEEGEIIQTLSPTVMEAVERLYETFDIHADGVRAKLVERENYKTKRKFLSIEVL